MPAFIVTWSEAAAFALITSGALAWLVVGN
jgi:hypothetical protein